MAGLYPDPTTWRMALDRDGSTWLAIVKTSGLVTELDVNTIKALSSEGGTGSFDLPVGTVDALVTVLLPGKRDVDAIFVAMQAPAR